jgi:ABC-2 type transport system permease protein
VTGRLSLLAAFIRRDWATTRSYRFAFGFQIIDSLIQLALFFYLSQIVGETSLAAKTHLSDGYFGFVIVGLTVVQIMHVGLQSFARKLRQDQTTGTLEALFVTPAPQTLVLVGSAVYDLLRGAAVAVLLLALGVLLFGLHLSIGLTSVLVLLVAVPAALAFFAGVGIALAAATVVFKQTTVLTSFVTNALAVLGGVYFPVSVFPGILESIAKASPVTWTLDVFRSALLRGGHFLPVDELLLLVGAGVIAVPVSMVLFRRALTQAKRMGSLGQY